MLLPVLAAIAAVLGGCDSEVSAPRAPDFDLDQPDFPVVDPSQREAPEPNPLVLPEDPDACLDVDPLPPPSVARRLSRTEFLDVLDDLFGVELESEITQLPPDIRSGGFSNNADALGLSYDSALAFFELARAATLAIPDWPGFVAEHSACTDLSDSACADSFIERLGRRVYRRPLDVGEIDRLRERFVPLDDGDSFEQLAALALRQMLSAPQFLYRLETTDPGGDAIQTVDGFAIATRLSFLIWGSTPDDALLNAAAAGDLSTPAGIEREVERLLGDPRAERALRRYTDDWLNLLAIPEASRGVFPEFGPALAESMRQETLTLVSRVLWSEESALTDVFIDERTTIDARLADLYGFDGPGEIDLGAVPERKGLLTQASVLTLSAAGSSPSIVFRGIFILEDILCGEVDPPPPTLATDAPLPTEGQAQRDFSEERVSSQACGGCHTQMDPLGYALDVFDGIGGYRTEDDVGNALRTDGSLDVSGVPNESFGGVDDFAEIVARSDAAAACMVIKPTQYALGRVLHADDACLVQQIKREAEANGGGYRALVTAIATHPSFRLIRTDGGAL